MPFTSGVIHYRWLLSTKSEKLPIELTLYSRLAINQLDQKWCGILIRSQWLCKALCRL
ncbi:hypothetical protein VCRA2128O305_50087 [Vibrio crassostreae]|uniref:Uncharacterized protein n=1 Tax=Vibrio crassostreae TaxID=246167 RepID=A0A822MWA0_9VIBR|nr:hypothetical protein VCRA2113O356_110148 [Vibrio crassostreae]CAK1748362.1 hypothetical protein VCRA2113O358_120147 [Vibrio crassostreae]CAK2125773.1 hypothetical protein VCRA2113O119_40146 [Vibrio crassostreae]CAK2142458.1 hypothetical protein VCRA2113O322_50097 [Vibrio crassostreae]CAK2147989.1 hypothetical protein VCRA2113O326_50147 [Vibrio crassostreae]